MVDGNCSINRFHLIYYRGDVDAEFSVVDVVMGILKPSSGLLKHDSVGQLNKA